MRDSYEFSLNQPIQSISTPREIDLVEAKQIDQYGRNALLQAAFQGDLERVKQLVQYKELLNQDNDGNTALHLAGLESHIDVVSYLLDHVRGKNMLVSNKRRESIFPILRENGLIAPFLKLMRNTGIIADRPIDHKTMVELKATIVAGLRNKSLTNLDLSYVGITDDLFEYFDQSFAYYLGNLETPHSLTHLSFQHTLLTHQSMELISKWLRKDKQLKSLNLSENKIGSRFLLPSGVSYIAKSLERNKSLEKLSLVNCHLNDSDAHALTRMLKHNTFLSELRLSENPAVSEKALRNMLKSLLAHPHGLKMLDLGNHYNQVFKNALRRVLNQFNVEILPIASESSSFSEPVKENLSPDVAPDDIKLVDSKLKDELVEKHKAHKLIREEGLLLFDEEYTPIKIAGNKHAEEMDGIERRPNEEALNKSKLSYETLVHHFETTLQRKLSLYWLAVGCLESKLIQPSKEEVEQTLKRLQIIIALFSMVPVISEAHEVAHGAMGMFEKIYESLYEIMESLHFVEFLSEVPVAHQVFHHLAKKLSQFKTISQEQMLENISHAFGDWEMCAEQCQQIAKAITHRYECIGKLDSLEDVEKLAEYTAGMILDFYKIGGQQKYGDHHEVTDAILDWLFYSSEFYYKNKKQPCVLIKGKSFKTTEFYMSPRLLFKAKDEQHIPVTLTLHMRIMSEDDKELIKTNSPILTRKGSKKEAKGLNECLSSNENRGNKLKQPQRVEFLRLETCKSLTDIQAFEFTYKTKSQRLEDLEKLVQEQAAKIETMSNALKNMGVMSNEKVEEESEKNDNFNLVTNVTENQASIKLLVKEEVQKFFSEDPNNAISSIVQTLVSRSFITSRGTLNNREANQYETQTSDKGSETEFNLSSQ